MRNTNKYKWGQVCNMGKAWQVPYFQAGPTEVPVPFPGTATVHSVANMTLEDTFWEVAHTPK